MRTLAIARLRLLTTIRSATPIFIIASLPPLLAATVGEIVPEPQFRAFAAEYLAQTARAAVFGWVFHGLLVLVAAEAFGMLRQTRADVTADPSDLMDSVPIGPLTRFFGEALGVFATIMTIHICCLPLLATVAVLSPLPTIVFVWIEAGIVAMMILSSTAAASKRLAPRTRWSSTRMARSGLLFLILVILVVRSTIRPEAFRDALGPFIFIPSMQRWAEVTASVQEPVLLAWLLSLIYIGFILYFIASTRASAEA